MKLVSGSFTSAALLAACLITNSSARADDGSDDPSNRYVVTNLVSDIKGLGQAPNTDPVLQNAWGVAFTPAASPFR